MISIKHMISAIASNYFTLFVLSQCKMIKKMFGTYNKHITLNKKFNIFTRYFLLLILIGEYFENLLACMFLA